MTKMFKIALPDGSEREMPEGRPPADVAAAIGPGLAKAALAAWIDGEVRDIMRPFEGDAELALITSRDEKDALELVRHDYAHVLAEAVQNLFPGTQITFGPATEDGVYYDFAPTAEPGTFPEEGLPAPKEHPALGGGLWKRDQGKIGAALDRLDLQPAPQGSVFWRAKGFLIWRQLESYMRRKLDAAGYDEVKSPQLMDARLWEASGHW